MRKLLLVERFILVKDKKPILFLVKFITQEVEFLMLSEVNRNHPQR